MCLFNNDQKDFMIEMLINYQWIWCGLTPCPRWSWQLSCLILHLNMCNSIKWLCLLHPTNKVRISSNLSSIQHVSNQHQCPNFTQLDIFFPVASISKQITKPFILSRFGYLACQLSVVPCYFDGVPPQWLATICQATHSSLERRWEVI